MSVLDVLGQDRPVWCTRGGVQPVVRDGRSIGQDFGGRRGQAEKDGGAAGCGIGHVGRHRDTARFADEDGRYLV